MPDYETYSSEFVLYSESTVTYDGVASESVTNTPDPDRYRFPGEFTILDTDETGYGTAYSFSNWSHISIHCITDQITDCIQIWVSNDGTNYVQRHQFLGSGVLGLKGPYKYIRARQVHGEGRIEVVAIRDNPY